jgi:conjugal transfer pilus assembly protein TraW
MRCSEPMYQQHTPRPSNQRGRLLAISSPLRVMIAAAALLAGPYACARDLGVTGPVYAIAEPSLIEMIQANLREMQANGGLARLQRESQARIRREVEQPEPVAGISKTIRARSFHFDPSIEVPYPITDAEGRVIVAPGTRVNPLDTVSLSRPLLFIDARDSAQLDRAQRLLSERKGQVKLILTGGSYLDLMRRWKLAVFYDQQGHLTTQLGIHHVPALVTQDGNRLRIDELL